MLLEENRGVEIRAGVVLGLGIEGGLDVDWNDASNIVFRFLPCAFLLRPM